MTTHYALPAPLHLDTVDSTLTVLSRQLADDPTLPSFSTVVARHQTAGRGRCGRTWADDSRSALLLATLVRIPHDHLSWVTPVAGLAVVQALKEFSIEADLKWPNDVLIEDRKVAGILCEHVGTTHVTTSSSTLHSRSRFNERLYANTHQILIGVGINLGQTPAEAGQYAGSVPLPTGSTFTTFRDDLLEAFRKHLSNLLASTSPDQWRKQYLQALAGIGQRSTVTLPDGHTRHILVTDVDATGALIATDLQGNPLTITTGDVGLPGSEEPMYSMPEPTTAASTVHTSLPATTDVPTDCLTEGASS